MGICTRCYFEVKQIQIVTRAFYCTAGWMKIGNMNSDGNLHLLLLWSKASLDCHQGFLLHNWLNKIGNNRTSYSPVGAGTGAELGNIRIAFILWKSVVTLSKSAPSKTSSPECHPTWSDYKWSGTSKINTLSFGIRLWCSSHSQCTLYVVQS